MNPMQAPNVGPGGKDFGYRETIEKNKPYFDAIALRAAPHVKNGDTMEVAIAKAMSEQSAFELEMLEGETKRTKMAREVLCRSVYSTIRRRQVKKEAFSGMGRALERIDES